MTTLLTGGRIYSPTHPDATAMAVRGDVIAWIGSDQVGRDQFPEARVVDLAGAFVAPAFVDSHVHVTATGLTRLGLDLREATSKAHCLRLIADHAAACGSQDVVWAHGWDDSDWPDGAPTTAELDAAVQARPRMWPGSTCTRHWPPPRCASARPNWPRPPDSTPTQH